jgi:CBS domain-containing protein
MLDETHDTGVDMNVAAICTRLPETVSREDTVLSAAKQMLEHEVGTLVITDDDGLPDGIVTDRDIVLRCVAEELRADKTKIARVMTTDVHTVNEDTAIEAALEEMADKEVRRLVVVNDAGRVVGIVALDDFLEGIVEATADVGRLLRRQVHL